MLLGTIYLMLVGNKSAAGQRDKVGRFLDSNQLADAQILSTQLTKPKIHFETKPANQSC